MKISGPNFCFDLSKKTCIMGILNVTPDSFSDGGEYFDKDSAIRHALQMAEDGADIIDIGGESTRPGSDAVDAKEEIKRTIPVIEALLKKNNVPISIDTYKSEVAKIALETGASIVNDISGLRFDSSMPSVIAKHRAPVVIMHIKGTPKNMQKNPEYDALIPEIMDYFRESIAIGVRAGINEKKIILDPGIGFGKSLEHNLEIINSIKEFKLLGKPVLIGPSRKSFIGEILGNASPDKRLEGTGAVVALSILNGANIIRVHDVKHMAKVAKIADAILRGKPAENKTGV
jgi:dihydropteroate synthase